MTGRVSKSFLTLFCAHLDATLSCANRRRWLRFLCLLNDKLRGGRETSHSWDALVHLCQNLYAPKVCSAKALEACLGFRPPYLPIQGASNDPFLLLLQLIQLSVPTASKSTNCLGQLTALFSHWEYSFVLTGYFIRAAC